MEMLRSSSTTLVIVLVQHFKLKRTNLFTVPTRQADALERLECPYECPSSYSEDQKAKVCYIDCDSPMCKAHCKHNNLQINGRFIGHRPAERTRDYTWIQALGILFSTHSFSVEATKAAAWDNQIDHLKFTHNGNDVVLQEGYLSTWYSPEKDMKVERISSKNSVIVSLKDVAEIMINVVPVTKEDDRIHNYQVPSDDCFAHLEVQFKFFALSTKVEGVLGRTYRPDFENPAKPGVAMPVLGGEDKYRTSSLLSADCVSCRFSAQESVTEEDRSAIVDYGTLDCTRRSSGGYGIVCKK
ncbi:hypothetical protein DVH24_003564 [Malus domestica]|uniref:Uncharacterized protein n=1 Tax=Malus domestica TaxID=3750 RepID=A0A498II74_MALDO|nr:hypothetical protein DVH24_003564 [Malus domestica]